MEHLLHCYIGDIAYTPEVCAHMKPSSANIFHM